MARILRARYFPDGNILTAVLKKKASYTWKSLLVGRDLLRKGLCFVIGDGSTVDMWTDPWLSEHTPRPPRPLGNPPPTMVSTYIKEDGSGWNVEKIREDVKPEDV